MSRTTDPWPGSDMISRRPPMRAVRSRMTSCSAFSCRVWSRPRPPAPGGRNWWMTPRRRWSVDGPSVHGRPSIGRAQERSVVHGSTPSGRRRATSAGSAGPSSGSGGPARQATPSWVCQAAGRPGSSDITTRRVPKSAASCPTARGCSSGTARMAWAVTRRTAYRPAESRRHRARRVGWASPTRG